jgi:glycosidase
MQQTATSINPDAYLVAEVWDSFDAVTKYYESGFSSIFNYPFGDDSGKLVKVVNGRGNTTLVKSWATALETSDKAYSGVYADYIDAPFLSNHDVGRIHGFVSGDPLRIKMAAAMNLFMSGSAFIMYGEEIGMAGPTGDQQEQHPSIRCPMYWSANGTADTTNPPPGGVVPTHTCGSVEEQRKDESSVYSYYRELIAIRKALPVISHGAITAETALNMGCVSAIHKTWNDQECIILMNIDDDEAGAEVDLSAYSDWSVVVTLSANGQAIEQNGTTLKLPAYGIAILTPGK